MDLLTLYEDKKRTILIYKFKIMDIQTEYRNSYNIVTETIMVI